MDIIEFFQSLSIPVIKIEIKRIIKDIDIKSELLVYKYEIKNNKETDDWIE